jgi:hypothetical protein
MLLRQFAQYILGFVFLVTSSFAFSNTEFTYNILFPENSIEVTGCVDSCPSDLIIPAEIDGFSAAIIGAEAFRENGLTSVTLPDTLRRIDYSAFQNNQLLSINIPDSVTDDIGSRAFAGNNLVSVILPENLAALGDSAFDSNQITSVNLPVGISILFSGVFRENQLTGSITIPDGITAIAEDAFLGNNINIIRFNGNRPVSIDSSSFRFNPIQNIYYCAGKIGWPGEPIEGITPQLDENCDNSTIQYSVLDIDQSGSVDALTDCLILLRYFFGLRGENLTNGAVSLNANRATAQEIEAYIQYLLQWTI